MGLLKNYGFRFRCVCLGQGTGYLNTLYLEKWNIIDFYSLLNPNSHTILQINDMLLKGNENISVK